MQQKSQELNSVKLQDLMCVCGNLIDSVVAKFFFHTRRLSVGDPGPRNSVKCHADAFSKVKFPHYERVRNLWVVMLPLWLLPPGRVRAKVCAFKPAGLHLSK